MKKQFLLILTIMSALTALAARPDTIDLAGLWRFQLDPLDFGKTPGSELYLARLCETIALPGSTDEGGKGVMNNARYVDRLSRKFEYAGPAWYQREVTIPESMKGKNIFLDLERCHWETTVYVDGRLAGSDERLSTPNRFNLTRFLTPGTHTITICVDNTMKYPMDKWAHGITEYTQTNWNGIAGDIKLTAYPATYLSSVQVYPDIDKGVADVKVNLAGAAGDGRLTLTVTGPDGRRVARTERDITMPADSDGVTVAVPMGRNFRLWDEFDPALYTLTADLSTAGGESSATERFGMRKVEQGKHHVKVNGIDRHLRGVLDCCVFPLTGYPATDKESWLKIFNTVRDYGFNHVRFHSWCPPEAAFDAADELGLYLQVELPMWIKDAGRYPARRQFFEDEMYAVLDEYGSHPSFVLYCNGNENEGDFAVLEDLIQKGQRHDSRHLYSASTARTHTASDQFYTSHVSDKGWITVYDGTPDTDWDVNETSDIDVPVIAHETGQRCMYPNFAEMKKYTGVLEPRNMQVFQERLAANGMASQADDFFRATGAHTVLQYKEVNEALLRSGKSGGYQLLGLQDFPGQGSAFVGILDPFWETKGLVEPEKYRESNDDVVLLARMPKRIYTPGENLRVRADIYNFGPSAIGSGAMEWYLTDADGNKVRSGRMKHKGAERATVDSLGIVNVSLDGLEAPARYTLHFALGDRRNEWDIWTVPAGDTADMSGVTRSWAEARAKLARGEKVLLIPDSVESRKTHFASHFWNPIMFRWDPMIVGTLIDADSKAFGGFPTDSYADWQWTDILNNGRAIDLTAVAGLTPVIQSVDTYEFNRKLGIAFEAVTPEGGRLFVLAVDPEKNIGSRPATRRLINSVSDYVAGDDFRPATEVNLYELDRIFDPARAVTKKKAAFTHQLLNQ